MALEIKKRYLSHEQRVLLQDVGSVEWHTALVKPEARHVFNGKC